MRNDEGKVGKVSNYIHNAVFSIIFLLFISGPAGLFIASHLDLPLPAWFTGEKAIYLSGANPNATNYEGDNPYNFFNGNFQTYI